jgi:hypothetical protein
MKKVLLFLAVLFIGSPFYGQSFSLSYQGDVLSPDETVVFQCDNPNENNALTGITICNSSSSTKQVKLKKVHINVVEGSENAFCWGMCYPSGVFVSPYPVEIEAEACDSQFVGEYNPMNNEGSSTIRYVFFDQDNPSDTISFVVSYDYLTGVNPNSIDDQISIFPNPANTTLKVTLGNNKDLKIDICNILGKTVKQVRSDIFEEIAISVSDLQNGIYFVRIMDGTKAIKVEKLIIRH